MEVVTILFRDFGNRENRKHARLKFLVDDWGIERFEQEIRDRLSWSPDPAEDWPEPSRNFRDHIGVYPQKQAGLKLDRRGRHHRPNDGRTSLCGGTSGG